MALFCPFAPAQEYPTPAPDAYEIQKTLEENRIKPQTEEFRRTTEELRKHVMKLRELVVRFGVSETPDNDLRISSEFLELLDSGFVKHRNMMAAALKEYRQGSSEKKKIGEMLARFVTREVEDDRYEGILDIAHALAQDGYPDPDLGRQTCMTALATNRFDIVRLYIEDLIAESNASETFASLRDDLPRLETDWNEELKYREEDAKGEPLPRVSLKTTKGTIEVELFENHAPETVANFIHLVERGFYDDLIFHRVIPHFAAQTGCPLGDGTGDDGYQIYGEGSKPNARKFFRGTLAMALAGEDPNSASTQFFVTFFPSPELSGTFTAFGRVTKGIEILGNLAKIDPDSEEEEKKDEEPQMPDEILEAKVLSKRSHDYTPNKVR